MVILQAASVALLLVACGAFGFMSGDKPLFFVLTLGPVTGWLLRGLYEAGHP